MRPGSLQNLGVGRNELGRGEAGPWLQKPKREMEGATRLGSFLALGLPVDLAHCWDSLQADQLLSLLLPYRSKGKQRVLACSGKPAVCSLTGYSGERPLLVHYLSSCFVPSTLVLPGDSSFKSVIVVAESREVILTR